MATIIIGENSYITLEEAETYLASSEWEALTELQQTSYLINARVNLDLMRLKGQKLDEGSQVLEFPRDWETTVSENVKMAQAYEALELATMKPAIDSAIASRSIQGASVTYKDKYTSNYNKYGVNSDKSVKLLNKYILRVAERC